MNGRRALAIGVFVIAVAFLPLSTVITPGEFEVRFPNSRLSFEHDFTATLADRTGLARGLAVVQPNRPIDDAVTNFGADRKTLVVHLVGSSCDNWTHLAFQSVGPAYVLHMQTDEGNCPIGTGKTRAVAISLWVPIDASSVRVETD
jgi:hypothetical protein